MDDRLRRNVKLASDQNITLSSEREVMNHRPAVSLQSRLVRVGACIAHGSIPAALPYRDCAAALSPERVTTKSHLKSWLRLIGIIFAISELI